MFETSYTERRYQMTFHCAVCTESFTTHNQHPDTDSCYDEAKEEGWHIIFRGAPLDAFDATDCVPLCPDCSKKLSNRVSADSLEEASLLYYFAALEHNRWQQGEGGE